MEMVHWNQCGQQEWCNDLQNQQQILFYYSCLVEIKFSMKLWLSTYAISSGNTDGNGYGNFEYAVPSGYYSLTQKT